MDNSEFNQRPKELEKLEVQNEWELEFTKHWYQVQIEENFLKSEIEENELQRYNAKLEYDIEEEIKVHNELLWYYNNEKKKIDDLTTYWERRSQDIEDRKQKLELLKRKSLDQREELEFYETMFQNRNREMDEYLADKERRRLEYEYEQYRHKMATKIQAWWRGTMVRRGLGPYKHLAKMRMLKAAKKRKMSLKKK